jgi:CheY-like chemotaxis protein
MWPSSDNEWTLLNLLTIDPRTRDIPVIICTAAVRHVQDMQDHLARIGVQVIHKPFNIDDLLGMITTTLDARQLAARTPPDGMEGDGYRG